MELNNPQMSDFRHVEVSFQDNAIRKQCSSFFRVKSGSYVIPRTEHKVTKLPDGIL